MTEKSHTVNFFGRTWFYRLKNNAKGLGMEAHTDLNNGFLVCGHNPYNKEIRIFGKFLSKEEFAEFYYDLDPEYRSFFEVIPGESPQKIYFDIEMEEPESKDLDVKFQDLVTKTISAIFSNIETLGEKPDPKKLMYFTSHGKDKRSAHLVLRGYYVKNCEYNREFYNRTISLLPKDLVKYVDNAVYSKLQQFRMYHSHKVGTKRVKGLCQSFIYKNEIVTIDIKKPTTNKQLVNILLESFVSNVSDCKELKELDIRRKPIGEVLEEVYGDDFMFLISSVPKNFEFRRFENGVYCFDRKTPSYCSMCGRTHEHENAYVFIDDSGNVMFKCRRTVGKTSKYLGVLPSKVKEHEDRVKIEYPNLGLNGASLMKKLDMIK